MPVPTDRQLTQVKQAFSYQPARYESIRGTARELATQMANSAPDSRELSLALTKLQEAVMWCNAAIACNE